MEKQLWRERQISWILIVSLIGFGCILRLIWAEDMKWKLDEIWMFETARSFVTGHQSFPLLGMRSSAGILNPGASVWCFILLAFVSPDPVWMVRWVAILNIIAIVLFFWFFSTRIEPNQRFIWLWGLAIAAVNPLTIMFSRKIWTCNILAPFCFLIFLGHWYRSLRWGAVLWGLVGTFVGQIHMSGFFFEAGLFLWTIGCEYKQKTLRKTAWTAWFFGTSIGAIFLIPWIRYLLFDVGQSLSKSVGRLFTLEFYLQWLTLGWGLNLEHDMGKVFWQRFLAEPRFFGFPSYGMAIAHLFLAFCALSALLIWLIRRLREKSSEQFPELTFYIGAGAIAMGGLMVLSGLRVPVYYLNVLFPFAQIWIAFLYRSKPRLLFAIAIAQLFISCIFLIFVHQNGGIPDGNYGTAYYLQNYKVKD